MMLPKAYLQNTRKPKGILGDMMLRRMNRRHTPLSEWAFSIIEIPPGGRILDAGCGGGMNLKRMLDADPRAVVHGLDYSEKSVAMSKKLCREYGGRCVVDKGNVREMPYHDSTFDLVTAFETVFFWKHIDEAFAEMHRVLKDGGVFAVVCEMSDPEDRTYQDAIKGLHILSAEDISGLMSSAGFTGIEIHRGEGEWICVTGVR